MIWLRQSTASQEIPLGRFVDSTDGDTEETGLTIANTDIKLWKTGATTLASKNSGGATHIANGEYYCVLDATDTDTLGPMKVVVHVTGALAVQVFCLVLPAAVYDSLVLGTDTLPADVTQIGGVAQSATDLKDFADTGYDPSTHKVAGVVTADALTANNDKTGYGLVDDAITAAKFDESTAFPLKSADTGATAVARTGADSDTLEILSDEIAAAKGVIDTIAVDVAGLDGEAMRGTNDAFLAATWTAVMSGITSLAEWLGLLAGKQVGDTTARTELRATGAGSGTFDETADSLEAIKDTASAPSAATIADAVWDEALSGHATAGTAGKALSDAGGGSVSVSYAIPLTALPLLNTSNQITVTKYDTLSVSLTGLGNVTNKSATIFMVKYDKADDDADAILNITEAGGLLTLEGEAYATSAYGSFAWTDTTEGDATLTIQEQATGVLTARSGMHFAIKVVRSTGVVDTLTEGTFTVRTGIIQAIT